MYIVRNLSVTPPTEEECDAIETIIYDAGSGKYVPSDNPDGFRALKIEYISPTEQIYIETIYAFEGHTLSGTEPTGEYEWQEEPEPEPDSAS
jgi:hypothetical protein